jgi:hypothetical protein
MCNRNVVRASLVIMGLCASLTLGLSACTSSNDSSSVPIREQLYSGDNRDKDPAHQAKLRERSRRLSSSTSSNK